MKTMIKYVFVWLTLVMLATSVYEAKSERLTIKSLGNFAQLDTVNVSKSFRISYTECDSMVLMIEVKDTVTVEVMQTYGTEMTGAMHSDTVQTSTTVNGTMLLVSLKAFPIADVYRISNVIIKVKGKTPNKAFVNVGVAYIKKEE
jgi:hypothetical protein